MALRGLEGGSLWFGERRRGSLFLRGILLVGDLPGPDSLQGRVHEPVGGLRNPRVFGEGEFQRGIWRF